MREENINRISNPVSWFSHTEVTLRYGSLLCQRSFFLQEQ